MSSTKKLLAGAPQREKVDAEARAVPESHENLEREIAAGIARAEAEIFAAESIVAMAESRLKALGGKVAHLRALALLVGSIQPEPIASAPRPPPIDDLTRERARRALARSGFVRVTP